MVRKWTNCQGTAISTKGGKYIGEFYNGKFNGQGIFMEAGRKYIGQYKDHKRHGLGTYTYANGDIYVGTGSDFDYAGGEGNSGFRGRGIWYSSDEGQTYTMIDGTDPGEFSSGSYSATDALLPPYLVAASLKHNRLEATFYQYMLLC